MIKVKIRVDEGVFAPLYKSPHSAGFEIMAHSFKKLYKGNKEVQLNKKLQKSINEGYITLRGFERLLVGTGLHIEVPVGYELQLRSTEKNALKKGLLVASAPSTISSEYKGELMITLINNSSFLSKVQLGDVIALGVINKIQHAIWEIQRNKGS